MISKKGLTFQQAVRLACLQAWAMSVVCGLLCLFAIAAATRIPLYIVSTDYIRLMAAVLFGLLALSGLLDNIYTHVFLRRLQRENGGEDPC